MKEWIMNHRTLPLEWIFKTINAELRGHYQYYGVTDNIREVKTFLCITKKLLFKWLTVEARDAVTHGTHSTMGCLEHFRYLSQVSR